MDNEPSTRPERRYSPTPYEAKSEATRLYRDGWHLGWQHLGTLGTARTRSCLEGMSDGPARHGYQDGTRARWYSERKAQAAEAQARQEARAVQRAAWAREAQQERAY